MAIKLQNKRSAEFSSVSMADLVFLLLIFFMVTSTLVSPNVINLLLPRSYAGKQLASGYIEVYIDADQYYYVNPKGQNAQPIPYEELLPVMKNLVDTDRAEQHIIIVRADRTVPIECVVAFYDILNVLNAGLDEPQRYKLLLATEAKSIS
jgi:biopolymer transport protein ExbD